MARRLLLLTALAGLAVFAAGWWLGARSSRPARTADPPARPVPAAPQREQSAAEKDRRIAELEDRLKSAMRDLGEQRQIIREHTLTGTARSADELLALFPAKYPAGDWSPAKGMFEDCWLETVDGLRIHGWYLRHEKPAAAILYLHGNAGNVTHRAAVAELLRERFGVSVLLLDYRGYGRSEGVPTIDGLVRDARAARDYLAMREGISPGSVVLMGRSLGGAVAVELAAADGARGLVLESTFSSLREVAVSHYPKLLVDTLVADRLDSQRRIRQFHGPLLASHGDADRTIPFELGRQLFAAANEPKTFVCIPGGDHNDPQSDEYYDQLGRFLAALPKE